MNKEDQEELKEKLAQYTAIELWKRWFDWSGDPWVAETVSLDKFCFFCGEENPNHSVNCVFVEAKKLVELDELGELG